MMIRCCNPTCAAASITAAKTDKEAELLLKEFGWVFYHDRNEGLLAHCPRCAREAA